MFVKGQSGNPGGKPKNKIWRDAIERAVNRRSGATDLLAIDELADALLNAAAKGDITALKELGDRLDGKPAQALEHSGHIATTHEDFLKQLDGLHNADDEPHAEPE